MVIVMVLLRWNLVMDKNRLVALKKNNWMENVVWTLVMVVILNMESGKIMN